MEGFSPRNLKYMRAFAAVYPMPHLCSRLSHKFRGGFFSLDGQVSKEGILRILEEHKSAGVLSAAIGRSDVDEVVGKELVEEAWTEVSQTDEVKRNLERLQSVIERVGY